eukprot:3939979-Rhodomonas_salina.1
MAAGGRMQYWVRKQAAATTADQEIEDAAPTLDLGGVGGDLPYKYMLGDWEWYHSYQDHLQSGPYWQWTHKRQGEEPEGQ